MKASTRRARNVSAALSCLLGLSGCLLPSFEQGPGNKEFCGLPSEATDACNACLKTQCCEEAMECAEDEDCAADFLKPIDPTQTFSTRFDPMLTCMQTKCDAACEVSWGCLDDYRLPVPEDNYAFTIETVDYASPAVHIDDVEATACRGVDSTCVNGRADTGVSADGSLELEVPRDFDGYFAFTGGERGGAPYLDALVQWSEPVYRLADFTHFMIGDVALIGFALSTGYHSSVDETFDPKRGHLIARVQGCLPMRYLNNPGPPRAEVQRVVVEAEPNAGASRVYYTDSSGGTSVTLDSTSSDGVAGAFEMPTGSITVKAKLSDSGEEVARTTVPVKAGTISFVYLMPRAQR